MTHTALHGNAPVSHQTLFHRISPPLYVPVYRALFTTFKGNRYAFSCWTPSMKSVYASHWKQFRKLISTEFRFVYRTRAVRILVFNPVKEFTSSLRGGCWNYIVFRLRILLRYQGKTQQILFCTLQFSNSPWLDLLIQHPESLYRVNIRESKQTHVHSQLHMVFYFVTRKVDWRNQQCADKSGKKITCHNRCLAMQFKRSLKNQTLFVHIVICQYSMIDL